METNLPRDSVKRVQHRLMQQTHPSDRNVPVQPNLLVDGSKPVSLPDKDAEAPRRLSPDGSHLRRFRFLYISLALVLLLIFVPPLVSVGRYQRRIASSISNSLGRPVHFDRVSLTLLPLPGFTIENLVVGEDPAFGYEPIIRANSVRATLRLSSLWRRRVEFSTISFADPSVNLVHASSGQWNIEGILLRASQIETAPTAQRRAGPAPRFPYIEASGARLNIKQEQEKLPFSLVDADFALWLPDPHQWHLRLRARPTRTDSNASDTGTIELEATLGAAPSLSQIPFNMEGQWRDAQLGEATRVLFGHDAGWRGQMNLSAHIRGTFGENVLSTRLHLIEARPADFVPERPLTTDVECFATATGIFHALEDLRCSWPPAASPQTPSIALTGTIPNVHRLSESAIQIGTSGIPGSMLVAWLRATTSTVPPDLTIGGILAGNLIYEPSSPDSKEIRNDSAMSQWHGQLTLKDSSLRTTIGRNSAATLVSGDVRLQSMEPSSSAPRHNTVSAKTFTHGFVLSPIPLMLGGHEPAVLSGHVDSTGYTLSLTGNATAPRLTALAKALPPLGKGLFEALPPDHPATTPFHIDLIATRSWATQQAWQANSVSQPQLIKPIHHRTRR
jgi:AsmA protein